MSTVGGNPNLCISCHQAGGSAAAKPFANADQAIPWPGLPSGTNTAGTSHRWDSGPSGRIQFLGGTSTGTLIPGGTFSGAYAKTYTITITTAGNAPNAQFSWTATTPGGGSGSGVLTGTNVALNEGITVTFRNGSGTSFALNDKWNLYVRPDLRMPSNSAMLARTGNNIIMCSTCHDQHSQTNAPFDAAAPAYGGAGTGAGRHFQRASNDTEQMCNDCHAVRVVTNAVSGSHPVGVVLSNYTASSYPNHDYFKLTTALPLEKATGSVRCETCHDPHYATATDGSLTRIANRNSLCIECHTLADTATPAAHFNASTGAFWPGGQYGSAFPQITDTSKRGTCVNCHAPHGWPDNLNTATHFPKLMVERFDQSDTGGDTADTMGGENLCYTCHNASGPAAKAVQADFGKTIHHPINDLEQVNGRSVECLDCHNVHQAQANANTYSSASKTITGAANNGSGLIRITATAHGFVNNDTVLIASVGGVTAANGTWKITVITANTFDLQGSTFSGTYTSGGTAVIVANLNRNQVSNPNKGVSGLSVSYTGLGNFAAPASGAFTAIPTSTGSTYEYQICFKCHASVGFPSRAGGTATFTLNSATVTGSGTAWDAGLIGSTIERAGDTATYTVTAVASATSLTISPVYATATVSGQNYTIRIPPDGLTPLYNTGTANFTLGSTTVTGTGTSWNSGMVGSWIYSSNNPAALYKITAVASATSLTIYPAYK